LLINDYDNQKNVALVHVGSEFASSEFIARVGAVSS